MVSLKRGYGWVKDRPAPAGQPDKTFGHFLAARRAAPAAGLTDLSPYVVDVLDQGRLGACVAHGSAQALRMREVATRGASFAPLPSRLMIYWLARKSSGGDVADDSGTEVRLAFNAIEKLGWAPESYWPYSDRKSGPLGPDGELTGLPGVDPFTVEPPTKVYENAYDRRQVSTIAYYRIDSTGSQRLDDIRTAISHGFPVVFGCMVSNAFAQGAFDPSSALAPPAQSDIDGGHCMLFGRFFTDDSFGVLNSWSADFGDGGWVKFGPDYVQQCDDLWIVEGVML